MRWSSSLWARTCLQKFIALLFLQNILLLWLYYKLHGHLATHEWLPTEAQMIKACCSYIHLHTIIYCRCTWMIFCRCWLSGDHSYGDHTSSKTQNHHYHQHSAELQHVWIIFPYILQALCTLWSTYCTYIIMNNIIAASVHTSNKIVITSFTQQHVYNMSVATSTKMLYSSCIYLYIYIYMYTNLYTYTYVISRLLTQLHTLESWNPEKWNNIHQDACIAT